MRSVTMIAQLLLCVFSAVYAQVSETRSPDTYNRPSLSDPKATPYASVTKFGAKGDNLNDDTAAIQRALDSAQTIMFPPGVFRITSELVVKTGSRLIGAGNYSGASRLDVRRGTTILRYDGPGGKDSCVVRMSVKPVGVRPDPSDSVKNATIRNLTIDGGDKAEIGLYMCRSWTNNEISYITVIQTRKHAFCALCCWNGTLTNLMAYMNRGEGFALGVDLWGWGRSKDGETCQINAATVDQSVCISFFAYYSGCVGFTTDGLYKPIPLQFMPEEADGENAVPHNSGFHIQGARALTFVNAQALLCAGPGAYINLETGPLSFYSGYFESNSQGGVELSYNVAAPDSAGIFLTDQDHSMTPGQPVLLSGFNNPVGFSNAHIYYVCESVRNTFSISDSPGREKIHASAEVGRGQVRTSTNSRCWQIYFSGGYQLQKRQLSASVQRGVFTTNYPHSFALEDPVVPLDFLEPTGFSNDVRYYVCQTSPRSFMISASPGGSVLERASAKSIGKFEFQSKSGVSHACLFDGFYFGNASSFLVKGMVPSLKKSAIFIGGVRSSRDEWAVSFNRCKNIEEVFAEHGGYSLTNCDSKTVFTKIKPEGDLLLQGGGIILDQAKITTGMGTPNARVIAPVGSLYLQTDGSAGSVFWVKESGTGSNGWISK